MESEQNKTKQKTKLMCYVNLNGNSVGAKLPFADKQDKSGSLTFLF